MIIEWYYSIKIKLNHFLVEDSFCTVNEKLNQYFNKLRKKKKIFYY